MQVVHVNKKGNYSQLRLLFPTLRVAENNIPAYARIIFSTFEYDLPNGVELFLLQDPAGIPLDTQSGLCTFLEKIDYMPKSKIDRLRKVVSFGEKELVYAMYHEAISLKIASRSYVEDDTSEYKVSNLIRLPLYERLKALDKFGYEAVFTRVLKFINKYQAHDASLSVQQYRDMTDALTGWNTPQLKTYQLTGNTELDSIYFMSTFPNRSN